MGSNQRAFGFPWRPGGWILALLGFVSGVEAAPVPEPGLNAAERQRLVQRWMANLAAEQFPSPGPEIVDADIRRHAESMRREALATLEAQALSWLTPAPGQPDPDERLGHARLLHGTLAALARLQLGRHDPAHAAAWLATLAAPRLCEQAGSAPGWAWHWQMLQGLPASARAAAFEADRRALRALGDPGWQPPPRPSPTPLEQLPDWLAEQRAGRDDGRSLGVTPILGIMLFGPASGFEQPTWRHRCVIAQWWARDLVHRGQASAADALLAFRYATVLSPYDWLNRPLDPTDAYPRLAAEFGVEAKLEVESGRDALGRAVDHRIVSRSLTVPDAPPGAWLAWDDHFDRHALAAMRAQPPQKPAAGAPAPPRQRVELVYRLE